MGNLSEIYKITFLNKGKVYEVFVKQVYQSDLYGFVEVEDYVFDEKKQVVVDPNEEKLKSEFSGVKRSFLAKPCGGGARANTRGHAQARRRPNLTGRASGCARS